jgi:hypothetical protein
VTNKNWTISIPLKTREITIHFDSMEEQIDYVNKEFRFSLKETNKYMTSSPDKSDEYKAIRDQKRLTFAKNMGYKPNKSGGVDWYRR